MSFLIANFVLNPSLRIGENIFIKFICNLFGGTVCGYISWVCQVGL